MITEHNFVRAGKLHTALTGTDEATGESPTIIIHSEPSEQKGQPYELVFAGLEVSGDTNRRGTPTHIAVRWEERHYDNKGNLIASYTRVETHVLTPAELLEFVQIFLPLLQPSIYNGAIRGGQHEAGALLGFNTQPLFDAYGQRIPDEVYDTSEPPTFDYYAVPGEPLPEEQDE